MRGGGESPHTPHAQNASRRKRHASIIAFQLSSPNAFDPSNLRFGARLGQLSHDSLAELADWLRVVNTVCQAKRRLASWASSPPWKRASYTGILEACHLQARGRRDCDVCVGCDLLDAWIVTILSQKWALGQSLGRRPATLSFCSFGMKLFRRCGYLGCRVGEASHPGPGGQAAKQRRQIEKQLAELLNGEGAIKLIRILLLLLMPQGGNKLFEQLLGGEDEEEEGRRVADPATGCCPLTEHLAHRAGGLGSPHCY